MIENDTSPPVASQTRREVLAALAALCGAAVLSVTGAPAAPLVTAERPFSVERLRRRAADLAQRPYQAPNADLPSALADLEPSAYRDIHYRPDEALWRGEAPFTAQFFHQGSYYRDAVRIFEVENEQAREIRYAPMLFDFGGNRFDSDVLDRVRNFAGFRIHYALNDANYLDELISFLGASYFRALGKQMRYGLSARGLAIDTAAPGGEEFPRFTEFYLERPTDANSIVIHALLDSRRCTGAYTFTVRPGATTVTDVELMLFVRERIEVVGIAPLTSMFFFGASDQTCIDDYRAEVHDSDGLLIWNGADEWLWRPLVNPVRLRVSAFVDRNPKGFGLMQRKRRYEDYLDPDGNYEQRPSAWIEPVGDWGAGAVTLVEIPSDREANDNIVVLWKPESALEAGAELQATYRLHWCVDAPPQRRLARVVDTRVGLGSAEDRRRFIVEFDSMDSSGGTLPEKAPIAAVVSASRGVLQDTDTRFNSASGRWRCSFELTPEGDEPIELRCGLMLDGRPVTETWCYQWTA